MTGLRQWLPADLLKHIRQEDQVWLTYAFERFGGYPTLEQIWALMDEVWESLHCDADVQDDRIDAFYRHPVWLLNGLFIEQHEQSLANRKCFTDWVVDQAPVRVAEFGGGFGTLARMIGAALPSSMVEVIEPHPHPVAMARAEKTPNVRYRPRLTDSYDLMIATDVFEHVTDPLQLVHDTAQYLRPGGRYLIANCFFPVIRCHLPQTFHFRHSWDCMMRALGLQPAEKVSYGRAFIRHGALNLAAARKVERRSQSLWKVTRYLPGKLARPLSAMALFK